MKKDTQRLREYVEETLGVLVDPTPWRKKRHLPHYLRALYEFFEIRMLSRHFLLMVDISREDQAPATIRKHMDTVRGKNDNDIIYVSPGISAFHRKRLIEQKVPFIVPGNQMYLPTLGIDLREYFRNIRIAPASFSPSTQAVVIFWLLRGTDEPLIPLQMANELGYSPMTMTRAFNELESVNLADVSPSGRERRLHFIDQRRTIWEKAQPFLRSPVRKRHFIHRTRKMDRGICAGLSALSTYSMLSEPSHEVFALSREDWKSMQQRQDIMNLPSQDPEAIEIEVWSYSPATLAEKGIADPLSLYLSFRDNSDERVEASLDEMIRGLQW